MNDNDSASGFGSRLPGLGAAPEDDFDDFEDGIRIVGRDEAEASMRTGQAVGRNSQAPARTFRPVDLTDENRTTDPSQVGSSAFGAHPSVTEQSVKPTVINDDSTRLDLTDPGGTPPATSGSSSTIPSTSGGTGTTDSRTGRTGAGASGRQPQSEPGAGSGIPAASLPHWTQRPDEEPAALLDASGIGWSEGSSTWSLQHLGAASGLGEAQTASTEAIDIAFAALGETEGVPSHTSSPSLIEAKTKMTTQSRDAGSDPARDRVSESRTTAAIQDQVSTSDDRPAAPGALPMRDDTTTAGSHARSAAEGTKQRSALGSRSLAPRIITGVLTGGLALAAFRAGPSASMVYLTAAVLFCAVEYYDALRRVGYRPATALGLICVAGALFGAYARGESAIPLVMVVSLSFGLLWYLTGIIKESPTVNVALTVVGIVWTGVFGSFGAMMLRAPHRHGVALILGAALVVTAYDTCAYIGGNLFGTNALAPHVSPNKTWEGLVTGTIAAVLMGTIFVSQIHPWSISKGLVLGIVIAFVAPVGDLAESMVKRDFGIKDMGRILPGHGGFLDRFDAMLFVFPATYYVARLMNLI